MNQIPKTLLRTPVPHHDESLAGYILRLGESNYYQSPNWIIKLANLKVNHSIRLPLKSQETSQLSQLTGLSDKQLRTMAYGAVIDKDVFSYTIHRSALKICPQCLEESPHCRSIWEHKMLSACPVHQCLLLQKCLDCQKNIKWSRPGVTRCNCGSDFRHQAAPTASTYQFLLSLYLYGLEGNQSYQSKIKQLYRSNNPVFDLTINQFSQLSKLLAYSVFSSLALPQFQAIQTNIFPKLESKFSDYSQWELTFSLFQNWSKKFRTLIDWKETQISSLHSEITGLKNMLGFVSRLVNYFSVNSNFSQFISNYIHEFLSERNIETIELRWRKIDYSISYSASLKKPASLLSQVAKSFNLSELDLAHLISCGSELARSFALTKFSKYAVGCDR